AQHPSSQGADLGAQLLFDIAALPASERGAFLTRAQAPISPKAQGRFTRFLNTPAAKTTAPDATTPAPVKPRELEYVLWLKPGQRYGAMASMTRLTDFDGKTTLSGS